MNGPLTVAYERFVRKHAPTELHIQIEPGVARAGEIALWLDRAYLSKVAIDQIVPQPIDSRAAAAGVTFLFAIENPD